VPAAAAESAQDTLGGAVSVAARLPDELGDTLLDVAQAAFTRGLRVTTAIAAVVAVAVAILAAAMLRGVRGRSERLPGAIAPEPAPEA
jgi:DHA2 family multidrug resistance protein-like MFS transporter